LFKEEEKIYDKGRVCPIPFLVSPKLHFKHNFINLGRTMDPFTHQLRTYLIIFGGKYGILSGEFLIDQKIPDGRCRFLSRDRNSVVLCYFKKGLL